MINPTKRRTGWREDSAAREARLENEGYYAAGVEREHV